MNWEAKTSKWKQSAANNYCSRGCSITAEPIIEECYGSACPCPDGNGTIVGWISIFPAPVGAVVVEVQVAVEVLEEVPEGDPVANGNGNLPTDPLEWDLVYVST